jgi:hypothetical protein
MMSLPPTLVGCFEATYPVLSWNPTACGYGALVPYNVGSTYGDYYGTPSGSNIFGASSSTFSMSGFTSESDSKYGTNAYSLQLNTNQPFETPSWDGSPYQTQVWEQFVFSNNVGSSQGQVLIQFWLIDWTIYSHTSTCPTTSPAGVTKWTLVSGPGSGQSCWADSKTVSTPQENPANLNYYSLGGFTNYLSSGNDEVVFCNSQTVPAKCYSVTIQDSVLNIYNAWTESELNIFGYCCISQANFNSGISITVTDYLKDQSGNTFQVSCLRGSYTAETSNLNLGTCNTAVGQDSFSETH